VGLDEALADRKAQAGTRPLCFRALPESIEDVWQVLCSDPAPRILHPEQPLVFFRCRAYRNAAAGFGEFERVADQVLKDLKEPVAIRLDLRKIRIDI